jgi:hypothetical protein
MRRLALAVVCCVLALQCGALGASAPALAEDAPYLPPPGKVFWGGQGGYSAANIADFIGQSGLHPAVYNYFISWRATRPAMHWLSFRLADSTRMGARTLLSVSTAGTGLTPAALARGAGDGFLIELGRLLAEQGQVTYLRPLSEMNNGDNPYSAYDLSGRPRGPAFSTRQFKRAWRRLALVVRGGEVAGINEQLRRLQMPPVQTSAAVLPTPQVALLWVPLSFGNPEIARNHPRHFWPGGAYVDWVGTTWYSPYKRSSAMEAIYRGRAWRRKPFVFAEWGVWGPDDPGFVRQFFSFLRSHPRVRMAVYYQSGSLTPEFRLSTHPRSRAALRRAVRWPRLTGFAPEFGP